MLVLPSIYSAFMCSSKLNELKSSEMTKPSGLSAVFLKSSGLREKTSSYISKIIRL